MRAGAREPQRVLILNSYHPGYQWTDGETSGVLAALGGSPKDVQVYIEYMGTKWASAPSYFQQLREAYLTKFQKLRFDVIVATDDDALRFLIANRDAIFGRIPTVFCGVNDFDPAQLRGDDLYTGVNEVVDVGGGLDLALRLHPSTRRVAVVSDSSISGRKIRAQFARGARAYEGRLAFEYLGEGPLEKVLDRIAHLPSDFIVFHLVYFSDSGGKVIDNDETAALVSRVSRVPVYGGWEFSLGHGIIGGKLLTGREQGLKAGEMAKKLLAGARPEDLPVLMDSQSRYMFDDEQLRRFGIRRADLPAGSVIINAPPSFYSLNKALVWGAVGGLAALSGVVVLLLASRARRRRAEEALRRSESRYRAIVEGFDGLIYVCSAGRQLEFVNAPLAARLIGKPPDATCHVALYGAPAPCTDCPMDRVLNGEVTRREVRDPVDGRWYHVVDVPIEHQRGVRAKQAFALDISDRKRAESRLRLAEQRLRLALEGADAYFWDWDLEKQRLDVDPRWTQIFGAGADGLEASPDAVPALFACEEDMPQVRELLGACCSGAKDALASKHRVRTGGGHLLWVRIRAKVVDRRPDGTPTRIAGTIVDITERKRLRERLEQAERLASIGNLAGSMAHEINNPLACVLANVEYAVRAMEAAPDGVQAAWAASEPRGFDELAQALREAEHSARRVRDIVRSLRRFMGHRSPAGIRTGLRGAVAQALAAARDKLVCCAEIVSEIPEDLSAEASESNLVQAFTALLVNAAEATASTPNRVRISARALPAEGIVAIEISDTGIGISPDALPRIFEPFFTTKGISGRGLGLSVSRGIIKSLGGDIEVESASGAGSTFRIVLPLASQPG